MEDTRLTLPALGLADPDMVSGWLCLEFTNTVENYRLAQPADFLGDYDALLRFGQHAGVLDDAAREALRARSVAQSADADRALDHARRLRATLYRVFSGLAHNLEPERDDLAILNTELAKAAGNREVMLDSGRFSWRWRASTTSLEAPLWPILQSAADLLTSPELTRLRQCSGHNCTWMFLDRSKNRSRRWCDMQICGNRAKSRRHYARTRSRANAR